jgi:hypothetical protein
MNLCRETEKMSPEDAREDDHIIRARCAPLSPASGFPVSRSQQPIHELSWLAQNVVADFSGTKYELKCGR